AHTDAQHRHSGLVQCTAGDLKNLGHGILAAGPGHGQRLDDLWLAFEIEHGGAEGGQIGEVDTDDVEGVGVELEQGGWFAGPCREAGAEFNNERVLDEVCHEVGDRHSGQSGASGDVSATEHAVANQG